MKADYDKIFKNEIITDLIKVIGCGVKVKTGKNKEISMFNLDNLRWNKIVICTDADVDGFHIRTLILTMLYRLVPTLIEKGYVYIAESPLFEITTSDKTYFAYDENEKTKILKMIGNKKFDIQRSKGLGENEAEMMSLTISSRHIGCSICSWVTICREEKISSPIMVLIILIWRIFHKLFEGRALWTQFLYGRLRL